MNENLNLEEILKDVPEGTELWSPLCGVVRFHHILRGHGYSIMVAAAERGDISFTSEGKYFIDTPDGECLLFPSKDQRDWAIFAKEQKEVEVDITLHPFDKVLVRDENDLSWELDLFEGIDKDTFPFVGMRGNWKHCIPYCEETAALLGTSEPCEIKYNITFDKTPR